MDAAYGYVSKSRCFKFQFSQKLRHLHLLFHFFLFHFFSSPSGNPCITGADQFMRLKRSLISSCTGFRPMALWQLPWDASVELAMSPFCGQEQLDMKETQVRSAFKDVDLINVNQRSAVLQLCWRELKKTNHIFGDISHTKQHPD